MIKKIILTTCSLIFIGCSSTQNEDINTLSEQDKSNIELLDSLAKRCSYAKGYRDTNTYDERTFLIVLQKCI